MFQDPDNIIQVKEAYELWLEEHTDFKEKESNKKKGDRLPPYPFLIVSGPVNNIFTANLVVNGSLYKYDDVTKAVDAFFKCCAALHSWPFSSEYIFAYIQEHLYEIPAYASTAFVPKTYSSALNFEKKLNEETGPKTKRQKTV